MFKKKAKKFIDVYSGCNNSDDSCQPKFKEIHILFRIYLEESIFRKKNSLEISQHKNVPKALFGRERKTSLYIQGNQISSS